MRSWQSRWCRSKTRLNRWKTKLLTWRASWRTRVSFPSCSRTFPSRTWLWALVSLARRVESGLLQGKTLTKRRLASAQTAAAFVCTLRVRRSPLNSAGHAVTKQRNSFAKKLLRRKTELLEKLLSAFFLLYILDNFLLKNFIIFFVASVLFLSKWSTAVCFHDPSPFFSCFCRLIAEDIDSSLLFSHSPWPTAHRLVVFTVSRRRSGPPAFLWLSLLMPKLFPFCFSPTPNQPCRLQLEPKDFLISSSATCTSHLKKASCLRTMNSVVNYPFIITLPYTHSVVSVTMFGLQIHEFATIM